MSYLTEPKDPSEIVTLSFDYSAITPTPIDPEVSIAVRWGSETVPTLAKLGVAQIVDSVVYQRVTGGADLHDYDLKCLASTPNGDKLSVDAVLAVRTRPI
jgi:hypothetical protein